MDCLIRGFTELDKKILVVIFRNWAWQWFILFVFFFLFALQTKGEKQEGNTLRDVTNL